MKSLSLIALGGLCFSASAMAAQPSATVTVNAPDEFGAAAIQQGDLARAEALLTDARLDAGDPVRLINLGDVYWLSGRRNEAIAAWRRALASADQYDVVTAGGRSLTTDQLAREALAAHARPVMTASR